MTNVKCWCTITVLLCQTQSMKRCKTQTVHGFAQNETFSISQTLFFNEQFNLESENRFDLLAKGHESKSTETLTSKKSFISGLKFSSININSIRGKKLSCWPSLIFINFRFWRFRRQKLTIPY